MIKYKYQLNGTAAEGQTWQANGIVETEKLGDWLKTPSLALKDAYDQLTHGRAIYGKPGVGCRGPYRMTRLVIDAADQ